MRFLLGDLIFYGLYTKPCSQHNNGDVIVGSCWALFVCAWLLQTILGNIFQKRGCISQIAHLFSLHQWNGVQSEGGEGIRAGCFQTWSGELCNHSAFFFDELAVRNWCSLLHRTWTRLELNHDCSGHNPNKQHNDLPGELPVIASSNLSVTCAHEFISRRIKIQVMASYSGQLWAAWIASTWNNVYDVQQGGCLGGWILAYEYSLWVYRGLTWWSHLFITSQ
jgi:hypothetical protein